MIRNPVNLPCPGTRASGWLPAARVAVGGEGPAPDTGTVCRGSVSGVSNRSKSEATRANAGSVIRLRQDGGLEHLVWAHRPTLITVPHRPSEVSTTSPRSKPLAADLGARGFVFVGRPPPTR